MIGALFAAGVPVSATAGTVQDNALANRWLNRALEEAQRCFGERQHTYRLVGCTVDISCGPQIISPRGGEIGVCVRQAVDENKLCWDVAHEAVHLLNPEWGRKWTNVFEEGLATYFQHAYRERMFPNGASMRGNAPADQPYRDAEKLVRKFMDGAGGEAPAYQKIRDLRGPELRGLSYISAEELMNASPSLSREDAAKLTTRF